MEIYIHILFQFFILPTREIDEMAQSIYDCWNYVTEKINWEPLKICGKIAWKSK